MGKALVAGLLLTASCGRLGFPDQALKCGQPTRFQVGATGITAIATTPTPGGFAVFIVAADKVVRGWSYDYQTDQLVAAAQNVQLATSATSAIGAASNGSQIMLSAMYGSPATGTALFGLDPTLATMGQGMHDASLATTSPVASSGTGFAFATVGTSTPTDVSVRQVTAAGIDAGAPVKIVAAAEAPGSVSIIATATGYAVACERTLRPT